MFEEKIERVIDRVDSLRHEVDDHWQIPRDEARLLAQIVRIGRFRSLCEIGVSYGFSTLHLAAAASGHGGHVHAIDISEKKIRAATANLSDAGLMDHVTLYLGDAQKYSKPYGLNPRLISCSLMRTKNRAGPTLMPFGIGWRIVRFWLPTTRIRIRMSWPVFSRHCGPSPGCPVAMCRSGTGLS